MIRIIFDGPPGPTAGRFVEVENEKGESISVGEWKQDGQLWALEIGESTESQDPREKSPHQQRVEEFMRNAQQDIGDAPTIPPAEVRILRAKLIFEEAMETIDALGVRLTVCPSANEYVLYPNNVKRFEATHSPNLVEIADGCADISVVTIGTLSACGIADMRLIEEVDRSNLAKFEVPRCNSHNEEMEHHGNGKYKCPMSRIDGTEGRCENRAVGPYRNSEGKWIKGPEWQPPNIQAVLDSQSPPPDSEGICLLLDAQAAFERAGDTRTGEMLDAIIKGIRLRSTTRETHIPAIDEKNKWLAQSGVATKALVDESLPTRNLCGHCKAPLSDELVKRIINNRPRMFSCPECRRTLDTTEVQLSNA